MTSVAERLSLADNESAGRWLRKNEVPIFKVGVKNLCYQIDFDYATAKPFVSQTLKDYPNDWERVLKETIQYEPLLRKILRNIEQQMRLVPTTKNLKRVIPLNKREKDLFKKLSSLQ